MQDFRSTRPLIGNTKERILTVREDGSELSPFARQAALREEQRRIRFFRFLSDLTHQRLCVEDMDLPEALETLEGLRKAAGRLFPGKAHVFDLVVAPRLHRVLAERFGAEAVRSLGS